MVNCMQKEFLEDFFFRLFAFFIFFLQQYFDKDQIGLKN